MISQYRNYSEDFIEESDHYFKHVSAMTGEKLNSKSDIAAELAFRDERIAELEKERDKSREQHYALAEHLSSIINNSEGVAGYHLNGDIALWDEFNLNSVEAEKLKEGE